MTWKTELIEAGRVSWEAFRANNYREIPPTVRCPLVNPFCPEDLCVLEAGHPGTKQRYHILGTVPYDDPLKCDKPCFMLEAGTTDEELVKAGWIAQQTLEGA